MRSKPQDPLYLVVLLSAAVFLLFFAPVLFGGQTFYFRDTLWLDLPWKDFYHRAFSWRPALWCPQLSLGFPSFANPLFATFYPPQLFFLLGDLYQVFQTYVVLHVWLGFLLTYRLARALGATPRGAWLAALSFSFAGFSLSRIYETSRYAAAAWTPGIAWAFVAYCKQERAKWLAWGALFGGLQILAGEPHFTLFTFGLLVAYALTGPRRSRQLRGAAILIVGSVLVGMAQVLPTLELLPHLARAKEFDFAQATQWSFHPLRLLDFFFPLLYGNVSPSPNFYWGKFLFPQLNDLPFSLSVYLGAVPMIILLSGWRDLADPHKRSPARFWVMAGVVGTVLSFGRYLPAYEIIRSIPGLANLRYPEKFLLLPTLAWSVAAGLMLEPFLEKPRRAFRYCLVILGLAGFAVLMQPLFFSLLRTKIPALVYDQGLAASSRAVLHAFLIIAPLPFIFWFGHSAPKKFQMASAVVLLHLIDLFIVGRQLLYVAPRQEFRQLNPWILQVPDLAQGRFLRPQTWQASGPVRSSGEENLLTEHRTGALSLRPNTGMPWGLHYTNAYIGLDLATMDQLHRRAPELSRYLALTGTRWVLTDPGDPASPELLAVARSPAQHAVLYENQKTTPRAFVVFDVVTAASQDEALTVALGPTFSPEKQVVLVHPPADFPVTKAGSPTVRVAIRRDSPEAIVIETETSAPGYLILNDTFYPGWRAWIDNQSQPILQANGLTRAVALPAGRHEVTWRFQPLSALVGVAISAASFMALSLLLLNLPSILTKKRATSSTKRR